MLQTEQSDTGIIQVYSMLCFHYAMVNTDTALMYGEKGLQLAKEINNNIAIANVSNSIGWAYLQQNNYNTAESYFLSVKAE